MFNWMNQYSAASIEPTSAVATAATQESGDPAYIIIGVVYLIILIIALKLVPKYRVHVSILSAIIYIILIFLYLS
jgi:hypothetical protein